MSLFKICIPAIVREDLRGLVSAQERENALWWLGEFQPRRWDFKVSPAQARLNHHHIVIAYMKTQRHTA
jgi:hypothetical protein